MIVSDSKSSYRQIVKATSVFGGVQIFNIIISIAKSKGMAVYLGSAGIGVVGLFTSTISFISAIVSVGLGISAVKDIAAASNTGNQHRIAVVVTSFRRLMWMTGIFGAFITLLLSPWLSERIFGNRDYALSFMCLSVTLLLGQLNAGQLAILQGLRKLNYLAKASIIGNLCSLVITLPLYYLFSMNAIVPGIILSSIASLLVSFYYANKIEIEKVKISRSRMIAEGKNMISIGFLMSMSNLMVLGTSFIVSVFISSKGGLEEVGLYTAGFTLISTYTGLIFNAMLTDYFPRLSAVSHDNVGCKVIINQQAEIAILILAPILIIFLIFAKWMIILVYTKAFIVISNMIYWAALGIFFKALSWSVGFIFIAKGSTKVFFWSELIGNIYMLILNLVGFHFFGLIGLGISFMVGFVFYTLQVYFISKIKFHFGFSSELYKLFFLQFTLAFLSFLSLNFLKSPYQYLVGCLFIAGSIWYSYRELDKRIGIKGIITSVLKKFINAKS